MTPFSLKPGLCVLSSVFLVATSVIPAAELPMEPQTSQTGADGWEVTEAPDAPWGLKSLGGPPLVAATGSEGIYTVRRGDTLTRISQAHHTTVAEIMRINGLSSDLLQPGQKLKVPGVQAAPQRTSLNSLAQERAETVRLQVFLDRRLFGPGRIDGLVGHFHRAALRRLFSANPELEDAAELEKAIARTVPEPYVAYRLREEDFAFIQAYGSGWPAMAQRKFLSYRTAWEMVAERFHSSEAFLRAINPHIGDRAPRAGDDITVPNVEPFLIEQVFPDQAAKFASKELPVTAVIRQQEMMVDLMRGDRLLAAFPITLGKPETRGTGDWTVEAKVPRPSYHKSPRDTDPPEAKGRHFTIQPGPNNPVGVLWLSLRKPGSDKVSSQGMHGTYTPDTIGRATSLGCIRLANWDIVRAARLLQPGSVISWR